MGTASCSESKTLVDDHDDGLWVLCDVGWYNVGGGLHVLVDSRPHQVSLWSK